MNTPGSRARAAGFALLLISVGTGINIGVGGFVGLLLCFAGVLAGVILVGVGVHMADDDDPAPVIPVVFDAERVLAPFLRRHVALVGLVLASSAVTAISGHAGSVLCFAMFALLLLGLSLINVGVTGE